MGLMTGKKGLIFGLSNQRGIAYAIAKTLHEHGATIACTYIELMKDRVLSLAETLGATFVHPCDVNSDTDIQTIFDQYAAHHGRCDFVVHAVAFANRDDLCGNFYDTNREGWETALGTSAYSLLPIAKAAKPLMSDGGSIMTLTYLGGERYVPHYNIMGVAKAALECSTRYLAAELGPDNIRVNALSAGPVKTLAAKGITGFNTLYKITESRSPMQRNATAEEVGKAGLYLCSDLSSGVTGETHHVDCGYHFISTVKADAIHAEK